MTSLQKLLKGKELSLEDVKALVATEDPALLLRLCRVLANQAEKARKEKAEAEAAVQELRKPPWHPGTVVCTSREGRLDVVVGGRRRIVATLPELHLESVKPGDEVFLDSDLTIAIAHNEEAQPSGRVGTVAETTDGQVVLRVLGDEELVVTYPPHLAGELKAGDRVLYASEYPCLIDRLPPRQETSYLIEDRPHISYDDIGGLDDLF
jgi:proteasome-associated ATPase